MHSTLFVIQYTLCSAGPSLASDAGQSMGDSKLLMFANPKNTIHILLCGHFYLFLLVGSLLCSSASAQTQNSSPPRPGVTTPGVRRSMADLHPDASFAVEGQPDWMVVTDDAVWVTSSNVNHVVRLDAATNRPSLIVTIDKPCSGLAAGFGAIWIPSCGAHALVRVDPQTGKIVAKIAIPSGSYVPAFAEGAVWITSTERDLLTRVDARSNQVVASIPIGP